MYGAPLDFEHFAEVTAPVQVVTGSRARRPAAGLAGAREVLPDAELRELQGVSHNVKMELLVPVIADFFAGERESPAAATLSQRGLGRRRRTQRR